MDTAARPGRPPGTASPLRTRLNRACGEDAVVGLSVLAFVLVRLLMLLASHAPSTYPDTPTYRTKGAWLDFSLTSISGRSVRPWGVTAWMALWPSDGAIVVAQALLSTLAWAVLALSLAGSVRRAGPRRGLVIAVLVLACTAQVTNWDLVVLGESVSISSGVLALAALVRLVRDPSWPRGAVFLALALWFTMTRPNLFLVLLGWAVALVVLGLARREVPGRLPLTAVVAGLLVAFSLYAYAYNIRSDPSWQQTLGYSRSTVAYAYPVSANDPVARAVIADLRRSGAPACMIPASPETVSDHGTTAWVVRTVRSCPAMDVWATAHWNRWWAGWLVSHPRQTLRIIGTELPNSLSTPVWGEVTAATPSSVSSLLFGSLPLPQSAVATRTYRTQPLFLWLAAVLVLALLARGRWRRTGWAVELGLAGTVFGSLASAVSSGLLIQTAPFEVGQESAAAAVLITASFVALAALGVDRLLAPATPADPVAHDAAYWDERYAASGGDKHDHRLSGGPDPTVVEVVTGLTPGRALDVATGRGRHALWLAAQGWQVTAVDFSRVAIDAGRAAETEMGEERAVPLPHNSIQWVVADATTWQPQADEAAYDLVLCAFFHLDDDVFPTVRRWLAPGGRLVVVGHALRNLNDGVGGPSNPAYLHSEDQLRSAATGLTIERLEEVVRPTDAGNQIDLLLVARRP